MLPRPVTWRPLRCRLLTVNAGWLRTSGRLGLTGGGAWCRSAVFGSVIGAVKELVEMQARNEVVIRIGRLMRQPLGEAARVRNAADHDRLMMRARVAHSRDELLHSGAVVGDDLPGVVR